MTLTPKKTKLTLLFAAFALFSVFTAQAQDKTKLIGNKPRTGNSNSSFPVIKGQQIGIQMKAGSKPVQLLKLNFGVDNGSSHTLNFKVNVYEFKGGSVGANLATQNITGAITTGKNRIDVDLAPYNIIARGDILVAIEWLDTQSVKEPLFSIGLFNGGTYRYKNGEWNKMAVAGVDFNVLVKKLR